MGERVLVTGGAGFIGANLVRNFLSSGDEVVIYDNFCNGKRSYIEDLDVEIIEGDINNSELLNATLNKKKYDSVVHLAALGSVVESVENPHPNFEVNALGTFNILNNSRLTGVGKVVFASTGGALMGNTPPPVNEQSLPMPISPYGASKLVGEGYASAFSNSFDLPVVACRFANVYGPYSAHKKGVITKYINAAINGEPITIFGDGKSVRDYIYVDDLCDGIALAKNKLKTGFDVFHLATGVGTTITDLANIVFENSTFEPKIEYSESRKGEIEKNFSTYDKAKEKLGFTPKVSLTAGIKNTYQWFQENAS